MSTAGLFFFITLIVLGLFDLGCVLFKGTGSTISAFMVDAGIRSPFFVFVLGVVAGHLLFPMRAVEPTGKTEDEVKKKIEK